MMRKGKLYGQRKKDMENENVSKWERIFTKKERLV
jgi:hypothetical protein